MATNIPARSIDPANFSANDALLGTNFFVFIFVPSYDALVPIATAQANTATFGRDTIDVSNKSFGNWAAVLGGRKNFSLSVDGILYLSDPNADDTPSSEVPPKWIGYDEIWEVFNYNGALETALVPCDIVGESGSIDYGTLDYFSGNTAVTGLDLGLSDNDGLTFSLTFQGSGKIDKKPSTDWVPNP